MLTILAEKKDQAEKYAESLKGEVSRKNKNIIKVRNSTVLPERPDIEIAYLQGHLYELKSPSEYDAKWKDWNVDNIPIFPESMSMKLKKGFSGRKKDIVESIEDSNHLWLATDSDVEGESLGYIFLRNINLLDRLDGRVWLESLTLDGLAKSFKNIQDPKKTVGKASAGFCRMVGDWLIGMNYSRLATILLRERGFQDMSYFPVGRVQTPTIRLIAQRRKEREEFKPDISYRIKLVDDNGVTFVSDKEHPFESEEDAKAAIQKLSNESLKVDSISKNTKSKSAPSLYKLGDMQSLMNHNYNIPSDVTGDKILEPLYNDYHLTSYPRTDSRLLTLDDFETIKSRLSKYSRFYKQVTNNDIEYLLNNLEPRKHYIDKSGKKIQKAGAHHALTPNLPLREDNAIFLKNENEEPTSPFEDLPGKHKLAYWHILSSVLSMFADDYKYVQTDIEASAMGIKFNASVQEPLSEHSYKDILETKIGLDSNNQLVVKEPAPVVQTYGILKHPYQNGQTIRGSYDLKQDVTKPPKAITESNLVGKVMPQYSLGTQATRGTIVKQLSKLELIKVTKRAKKSNNLIKNEFVPTDKALVLLDLLNQAQLMNFSNIKNWQEEMDDISSNDRSPKGFVKSIRETTNRDINYLKQNINNIDFSVSSDGHQIELAKNKKEIDLDIICPKCRKGNISSLVYDKGGKHHEFYVHKDCKFFIPMEVSKVEIKPEDIDAIFLGKYPETVFTSKNNKPFKARLKYGKKGLEFLMSKHFTEQYDMNCPLCKENNIGLQDFENKQGNLVYCYACNSLECKFKCIKHIAGLDITPEMMTNIINGEIESHEFISKRGKKFNAALMYKSGSVKMVFLKDKVKEYEIVCPVCNKGCLILTKRENKGKTIYEYACSSCKLSVPQKIAGKEFSPEDIVKFLTDKEGKYQFYSSKSHKNFTAKLEFHPRSKQQIKMVFDKKPKNKFK